MQRCQKAITEAPAFNDLIEVSPVVSICKIVGLVHIRPPRYRRVIRQQLQRHHQQHLAYLRGLFLATTSDISAPRGGH